MVTGSQVLQATGTTTDFDSQSVEVRRRSTLEFESLVKQSGHPQRTNRSSWGPNLQQGDTSKPSNCPNSNVGPLTDSCLPCAAGRNLKSSGGSSGGHLTSSPCDFRTA
ncbi:hypothetical protein CDL15_Pgr009969 [Punica granatum]|uniref:Uncharacterized protein n=1 Tax=Punica granatum TaxID=22663 RepID=A0A218XMQ6_PUNGR|nr:hypothetical protein CDL15_Pgr009969 [Punica granatum]